MKKYKLFLLGGIISILSIGCFTSAWKEEFVYHYTNTLVVGQTCNFPASSLIYRRCFNFPNNGGRSIASNITVSGLLTINSANLCPSDYPYLGIGTELQYNSRPDVKCYVENSKMPVSALTPAIDGLRGTVYEIIPYVIYIGIGVLLAILGFYVIRWLVNWMGGKINSYFSSKKR